MYFLKNLIIHHIKCNGYSKRNSHQKPLSTDRMSFGLISCALLGLALTYMAYEIAESDARPHKGLGSLRGSASSLTRQQYARKKEGLKLHHSWRSAKQEVRDGGLLRIRPSKTLQLANVSHPYAHPELKMLLEKLSRLYWSHCRAPLVVTSLLRPINEQPRNASTRSVHPAGIAADLRVPPHECRAWLRQTLSSWERAGLIEATRERRPPHFHLVAIPHRLTPTLISNLKKTGPQSRANQRAQPSQGSAQKSRRAQTHKRRRRYRVRRGDSLWSLSRRWRVSETAIKRANRLSSSTIQRGQILLIPSS